MPLSHWFAALVPAGASREWKPPHGCVQDIFDGLGGDLQLGYGSAGPSLSPAPNGLPNFRFVLPGLSLMAQPQPQPQGVHPHCPTTCASSTTALLPGSAGDSVEDLFDLSAWFAELLGMRLSSLDASGAVPLAPKYCGACRRMQAGEAFFADPSSPDGLSPWCGACLRAQLAAQSGLAWAD